MKTRLLIGLALLLAAAVPAAAQEGGQVVGGDASITNPDASTTQIDQFTNRAIINWRDFSIGEGNQVLFNQPTSASVALNRVVGQNPSAILGSLNANGQVFVLNPHGIVFGANSQVNVNGFVASTLALSNEDFMEGNYSFTQDPSAPQSYIVNNGTINATSFAALVAPLVENTGTISSPGGTVYLLASSEVVLDITGDGLIGYSIGNVGGGTVNIREDALSDVVRAVVNTDGLIEAGQIVQNADGSVSLEGPGTTQRIDPATGQMGEVASYYNVDSVNLVGAGGTVVNSGTLTTEGVEGGEIIINSDTASVLTPTSELLSDGGFIEFSTKGNFVFDGIVNPTSPSGATGSFLLDPHAVVIVNPFSTIIPGTVIDGTGPAYGPLGPDVNVVTEGDLLFWMTVFGFPVTITATDYIHFDDVGPGGVPGPYVWFGGAPLLPGASLTLTTLSPAPAAPPVLSSGGTFAEGIAWDPLHTIDLDGAFVIGNPLTVSSASSVLAGGVNTFGAVSITGATGPVTLAGPITSAVVGTNLAGVSVTAGTSITFAPGVGINSTLTSLSAGTAIIDGNGAAPDIIGGGDLEMLSGTGIGTPGDPIELLVSNVEAQGGVGGVHLVNDGGTLIVGLVPGVLGLTGIDADGDISIDVIAAGADLSLFEPITTLGGSTITLDVVNNILDNYGGGPDIVAGSLAVDSALGVFGLDMTVAGLEANVGANGITVGNTSGLLTLGGVSGTLTGIDSLGDVTITNFGDISITEAIDAVGATTVTAMSPVTISANITSGSDITITATESGAAGDDLTVDPGISVTSTAGAVTLRAGDDLLLDAGSTVSADDDITLTAAYLNADAFDGFLTVGAGSTVNGGGNFTTVALSGIGISLAAGSDVNNTGNGAITVTSLADGDITLVNGSLTLGDGTLTLTADGDDISGSDDGVAEISTSGDVFILAAGIGDLGQIEIAGSGPQDSTLDLEIGPVGGTVNIDILGTNHFDLIDLTINDANSFANMEFLDSGLPFMDIDGVGGNVTIVDLALGGTGVSFYLTLNEIDRNVIIENGSIVAGGDIFVSAAGNIELGDSQPLNGAAIVAAGDVSLEADNDAGGVTTLGAIIYADGDIDMTAGGSLQLLAGDGVGTALAPIVSIDATDISGRSTDAAAGGFFLTNNGTNTDLTIGTAGVPAGPVAPTSGIVTGADDIVVLNTVGDITVTDTVTSGAGVELTATAAGGSPGDVTVTGALVTANDGDIDVNADLATGSILVTGSGLDAIDGGSLDGNIFLDAPVDITVTGSTLTADADIRLDATPVGGTITIDGGSLLDTESPGNGGLISVQADGAVGIDGATLRSGGDIDVDSLSGAVGITGGAILNSDLGNFFGNIEVRGEAGVTITGSSLVSDLNILVEADTPASGSGITIDGGSLLDTQTAFNFGTITVRADGLVSVTGPVTAIRGDGTIDVDSNAGAVAITAGAILDTAATAGFGNIEVRGETGVTITASTLTSDVDIVVAADTLASGAPITIDGGSILDSTTGVFSGGISVQGDGLVSITGPATRLTSSDTIDVDSLSGAVSITAGSLLDTLSAGNSGDIEVRGEAGVTITGSTLDSDQNITVLADTAASGAPITINGASSLDATSSGFIVVTADGAVLVDAGSSLDADGTIDVTSVASTVTIDNSSSLDNDFSGTGGDITIDGSTGVTIDNTSTVTADTNIVVDSLGTASGPQSILIDNGSSLDATNNGQIDVTGEDAVVIQGGSSLDADQPINVTSLSSTVTIDGSTVVNDNGNFGDITIDGDTGVSILNGTTITAEESIIVDSLGTASGAQSVLIDSSTLDATNDGAITVTGEDDVVIDGASTLDADATIDVTSLSGTVTIDNSSSLDNDFGGTGGDITIDGDTGVTIDNTSTVTADQNIVVLSLSPASGAQSILIDGGSSLDATNNGGITVTGEDDVVIDGASTLDADLDIDVTSLSGSVTIDNGSSLDNQFNNGAITVDGDTAVTINNGSTLDSEFDLTVRSLGVPGNILIDNGSSLDSSDGQIIVDAAGTVDILALSSLTTNGSGGIDVDAGGDIDIDDSDLTADGGDITIDTTGGTVTIQNDSSLDTAGAGSGDSILIGDTNIPTGVSILDSSVQSDADVEVNAGATGVQITSSDIDSAANAPFGSFGNVIVSSAGPITIDDVGGGFVMDITAGDGDVDITTTSGAITVENAGISAIDFFSGLGNITIDTTAGTGNVSIDESLVVADRALFIQSIGGNVVIDTGLAAVFGSTLTAAFPGFNGNQADLDILAPAGSITIGNLGLLYPATIIETFDGDIRINSAGATSLTSADVNATDGGGVGNVLIDGDTGVTLLDTTVVADTNIDFISSTGSISIDDLGAGVFVSAGADLRVLAGDDITLNEDIDYAGQAVLWADTDDLGDGGIVQNGFFIDGTGNDLLVVSTDDVDLGNSGDLTIRNLQLVLRDPAANQAAVVAVVTVTDSDVDLVDLGTPYLGLANPGAGFSVLTPPDVQTDSEVQIHVVDRAVSGADYDLNVIDPADPTDMQMTAVGDVNIFANVTVTNTLQIEADTDLDGVGGINQDPGTASTVTATNLMMISSEHGLTGFGIRMGTGISNLDVDFLEAHIRGLGLPATTSIVVDVDGSVDGNGSVDIQDLGDPALFGDIGIAGLSIDNPVGDVAISAADGSDTASITVGDLPGVGDDSVSVALNLDLVAENGITIQDHIDANFGGGPTERITLVGDSNLNGTGGVTQVDVDPAVVEIIDGEELLVIAGAPGISLGAGQVAVLVDVADLNVSFASAAGTPIVLYNTGSLLLDDLGGLSGESVLNGPGTVDVRTVNGTGVVLPLASDLTIDAPVRSGQDIHLATYDGTMDVANPGTDIIDINAAVDATFGVAHDSTVEIFSGDCVEIDASIFAELRVDIRGGDNDMAVMGLPGPFANDIDNIGCIDQISGTITLTDLSPGSGDAVFRSLTGTTITSLIARRLQATNAIDGNIDITVDSDVELADIDGLGFSVLNAAGVFPGPTFFDFLLTNTTGSIIVSDDIFTTGSVTMTDSDAVGPASFILVDACIQAIAGTITLNTIAYPGPASGLNSVFYTANSCFISYGPASYVLIACDNDPATNLDLLIESDINVPGRVVLIAEGSIVVNGAEVTSLIGIVAIADWQFCNPDNVGSIHTVNGGLFRADDFQFQAGGFDASLGANVAAGAALSLNPLFPAPGEPLLIPTAPTNPFVAGDIVAGRTINVLTEASNINQTSNFQIEIREVALDPVNFPFVVTPATPSDVVISHSGDAAIVGGGIVFAGSELGIVNPLGSVDLTVASGERDLTILADVLTSRNQSFTATGDIVVDDVSLATDMGNLFDAGAPVQTIRLEADSNGNDLGLVDHNVNFAVATPASISTDDLVVIASEGITLPNTFVSRAQLINLDGSGDIFMHNTGDLELLDLDPVSTNAVDNNVGNVFIEAASDITVTSPVSASGDITLRAIGAPGSDIFLNESITSTGAGIIDLFARANIVDDGIQTTVLDTAGRVILEAELGAIGHPVLTGLANYVDVNLGGTAQLSATAAGNVLVQETGVGIDINTGQIVDFSSATGGQTLGLSSETGDVVVDANFGTGNDDVVLTGGDVSIGASATVAGLNRVTITATANGVNAGTITQAAGVGAIQANQLVASAVDAISLSRTQVSELQATSGTSSVSVANIGDLSLTNITGGVTSISAATLASVSTTGDLDLVTLVSATDVVLSADGSITDGNGAANNITATTATLSGDAGIDVDTDIDTLTAASAAGNITVREASGLALTTVDAALGTVTITLAAGALTDGGATSISALAADLSAPASIDVNTAVDSLTASTAGTLTVSELDDLSAVDLSAPGSSVDLTAGGAIGDSDAAVDVTTDTLTITAASVGSAGNPLGTDVDDLTVDTSASNGAQFISESNDLPNLNLNAGSGTITLTANGFVRDVAGDGTDLSAGSATIVAASFGTGPQAVDTDVDNLSVDTSANNGNQFIEEANALLGVNLNAGTGNVTLTAGNVFDSDSAVDFTADTLTVDASRFGQDSEPIGTAVDNLTVTTTLGGQYINEVDDLNSLDLTALTFAIDLTAGGIIRDADGALDIQSRRVRIEADRVGNQAGGAFLPIHTDVQVIVVDTSISGGNQFIEDAGNLTEIALNAGTGTIEFSAAGFIEDGDNLVDVTAFSASLSAADGIGSLAPIMTAVDRLTVSNTASGDIVVLNTGDVVIDGASNLAGAVDITAQSDMTIAGLVEGVGVRLIADGNLTLLPLPGTVLATGAGNIVMTAVNGDMTLDSFVTAAGDRITLTAGGWIQQTGGTISGLDLVADAVSGIWIPTAIVANLQATNTTSGTLLVYNGGTLTLTDLTTLGHAVLNDGGDVIVETGVSGSNLIVDDLVEATGSVTLEADGDLTLNADVEAGTFVLLEADRDNDGFGAILRTAGVITAPDLIATAPGGISVFTEVDTITASTVNSAILVNELDDLSALDLDAGTGTLTLTVGGAIADSDAAVDVVGTSLIATAGSVGSAANPLGTDVDTLTLDTSATGGDQFVAEVDGIILSNLNAGTGDITLTAGGTIADGGLGTSITASGVTLTAGTGIGSAGTLLVEVDTLTAAVTGAGVIDIADLTGAIRVVSATTANGDITIFGTAGDMTADSVVAGGTGGVALLVGPGVGNLFLGEVAAPGNSVILSAPSGVIADNNGAALNVTADLLDLSAGFGIGSASDPIETSVNDLSGAAAGAGGLFLTNASSLRILGTGATAAGDISISAAGTLDVSSPVVGGPIVTLTAGVDADLRSDVIGGQVHVTAGRNIRQFAGTVDGTSVVVFDAGRMVALGDVRSQGGLPTGQVVVIAQTGSIINQSGGLNITANAATLIAGGGIGTAATPIQTDITQLEASAGSGGVYLANAGAGLTTAVTTAVWGTLNGVSSAGGDIVLSTTGDLTLDEAVNAGSGNVSLTSTTGAIVDGNPSGIDVIGGSIALAADTGIGSGDALEISGDRLTATNVTSNGVRIEDAGDLIVDGASNTGGSLDISASGSLTVAGDVTASGFLDLVATGGSLTVQDSNVTSTLSEVFLGAAGDIFLLLDPATISGNQGVIVDAGGNIVVTGDDLFFTTEVSSAVGDIDLIAGGNVTISGAVALASSFLDILAAGDLLIDQSTLSAVVGSTSLNAGGSVTANQSTLAGNADLTIGATGDVSVTGGLLQAGTGDLSVSAGGSLSITGDGALGTPDVLAAGDVNLDGSVDVVLLDVEVDSGLQLFLQAGNALTATNSVLQVGTGASISAGSNATFTDADLFGATATSLTAGGDLILSGGSNLDPNGNVSVTVGGNASLSDDVTIAPGGSVDLDVTGDLTLTDNTQIDPSGSVTATVGGNALLSGNADISPSGSVSLDVTGNLSLTDSAVLDPSGSVTATVGANVLLSGDANIDASGSVDLSISGDLTVVDDASIDPSGSITASVGGNVLVDGDGDIDAGGDLDLTSGGDITVAGGDLDANGTLGLTAGGDVFLGNNVSVHPITVIVVAGGSITMDGSHIHPSGSISLDAGTDLFLLNGMDLTASSGSVVVTAGGNLLVDGSDIDGNSLVDLTAAGNVALVNADVSSDNDDVNVTAGGSLTVDGSGINTTSSFSDDLTLQATGDVFVVNSDLEAGFGDLSITSGGDVTLVNSTAIAADSDGSVDVAAAGNLTIDESGVFSTDEDVTLTAGGSLTIRGLSSLIYATVLFGPGGDVILNAGQGIAIEDGALLTDDGNIEVTAGDNLDLVNGFLDATGNRITLIAGGWIQAVAGGSIVADQLILCATSGIWVPNADVNTLQAMNTASGTLTVYDIGDLDLVDLLGTGSAVFNAGGDIVIETGTGPGPLTGITVSDPIEATGNVTIDSDDSIIIDADITSGDTIVLIADEAIDQTGGLIQGNDLILEADDFINLPDTQVNRLQAMNTGSGEIFIQNSGTLVVTDILGAGYGVQNNNLDEDNDTVIEVNDGDLIVELLVGYDDIELRTNNTGNVLVGSVTSVDDDVEIESAGDILEIGDDTTSDLTAFDSIDLDAAGAIGTQANPIEVDAQLQNGGSSDWSANGGDLNVTDVDGGLALDDVFAAGTARITALGGDLSINDIDALALEAVSVGGSITVTDLTGNLRVDADATGDILIDVQTGGLLLGLIDAGGTATLMAGSGLASGDLAGSILDDNDVVPNVLNVRSGGDATFNASGVVGLLTNCIEVEIGGNAFVTAGGSINGISIALCGTTGGGSPIVIFPGPGGATTFNGLEFLPALIRARASMNPMIDPRRTFDPILHYPLLDSHIDPQVIEDERDRPEEPQPGDEKPADPSGARKSALDRLKELNKSLDQGNPE